MFASETMLLLPLFIILSLIISMIITEMPGSMYVALFMWVAPVAFGAFLAFLD